MLPAKNYYNRPVFHEAIKNNKSVMFLWTTVYKLDLITVDLWNINSDIGRQCF